MKRSMERNVSFQRREEEGGFGPKDRAEASGVWMIGRRFQCRRLLGLEAISKRKASKTKNKAHNEVENRTGKRPSRKGRQGGQWDGPAQGLKPKKNHPDASK